MSKEKYNKCSGEIQGDWRSYPCTKNAKYFEDDKWWCGIHAPSKVKERQEKRDAKERAEVAREKELENIHKRETAKRILELDSIVSDCLEEEAIRAIMEVL